jgi:hypothetical protein
MFDPLTVALEIKYPWRRKTAFGYYRDNFITIWHKDPCKDGSDNSCDWHGSKKRSPTLDKMRDAIRNLETILDNTPFYPDHEAHLRFKEVHAAYWELKKKSKFRVHPRWHIWHWRIQVIPLQILYRWLFERCSICKKGYKWKEEVMGNWDGNRTWHFGCDHKTYKDITK